MSFCELSRCLSDKVKNRILFSKYKGSLKLYKHTLQCQYNNLWDEEACLAGGIILDFNRRRVAAYTIPKFFNLSQLNQELPDEPFEITEKVNGSCVNIFHSYGMWHTSTLGSFNSAQAVWTYRFIVKNIGFQNFDKNYNYIAEAVYPENRIVVNYGQQEKLVALAAFDRDGYEHGVENFPMGFDKPARLWVQSVDKAVRLVDQWDHNAEGVVVRFGSGKRVKIKSQEYLKVHRMISNVSPLAAWRVVKNCEDTDKYLEYFPDEFMLEFQGYIDYFKKEFDFFCYELKDFTERLSHMSDSQLGEYIQRNRALGRIDKNYLNFIFHQRKNNIVEKAQKPGKDREKLFNIFRPKGNFIENENVTHN